MEDMIGMIIASTESSRLIRIFFRRVFGLSNQTINPAEWLLEAFDLAEARDYST